MFARRDRERTDSFRPLIRRHRLHRRKCFRDLGPRGAAELGLGVGGCGDVSTPQLLSNLVVIRILKEFGPRVLQYAALQVFADASDFATEPGMLEVFFRLADLSFSDRPARLL